MNASVATIKTKNCSNCGISFACGNRNERSCWCNDFPPIFNPDSGIDCFCPACLKQATIKKTDAFVSSLPIEEAIKNKAQDLPKTNKLVEGVDYYMEDGMFVFKPWYHLKRGHCCENGCRHCPYGFKKETV